MHAAGRIKENTPPLSCKIVNFVLDSVLWNAEYGPGCKWKQNKEYFLAIKRKMPRIEFWIPVDNYTFEAVNELSRLRSALTNKNGVVKLLLPTSIPTVMAIQ